MIKWHFESWLVLFLIIAICSNFIFTYNNTYIHRCCHIRGKLMFNDDGRSSVPVVYDGTPFLILSSNRRESVCIHQRTEEKSKIIILSPSQILFPYLNVSSVEFYIYFPWNAFVFYHCKLLLVVSWENTLEMNYCVGTTFLHDSVMLTTR